MNDGIKNVRGILKIYDVIFIVLIGVPLLSALYRMAVFHFVVLLLSLLFMLALSGFFSRCVDYYEQQN